MGLGTEGTLRDSLTVEHAPSHDTSVNLEYGHRHSQLHAHLSLQMLLIEQGLTQDDMATTLPHPRVHLTVSTTWSPGLAERVLPASSGLHSFARAAITKNHNLEARSPRSRCQQGWFLPRAVGNSVGPACLLVSGASLAILDIPSLLGASLIYAFVTWHSRMSISVSKFFLFIRTHPTPV